MPIAPASRPSTDDEDRRRALPPKRSAAPASGPESMPFSREEGARCRERRGGPRQMPTAPLPVGESKSATGARRMPRSLGGAHDRLRRAGARWRARRWPRGAGRRLPSKPSAGDDGRDGRPPFGQRAGLVDDERVDLLHALQRLGVLDQHAGLRAAADADHDRHRRREAERARAGDDEHGDGRDQAVGEARLRAPDAPGGEGERPRPAMTAGTNQPETWSARRWIGARLRCASATSCTICASSVSRPTFSARITRLPVWFIVPPITRAPGSFVDRHRFAGDHAIRRPRPCPSMTTPSTGTRSPGRTRRTVADRDLVERDLLLAAVRRGRGARSSARGRAARGSRRRSTRGRAAPAPGRAAPAR